MGQDEGLLWRDCFRCLRPLLILENEKRKFIKKCVSSSGSSGPERQKGKTSRIKPKKKLKSKSKKGKPSFEKRENPEMSNSKKTVSTDDGYIKAIDDIDNAFNETLRWNNICSDSEEEDERLRIYKENRRKRYVEAMHVKVAQRMSGLSQ